VGYNAVADNTGLSSLFSCFRLLNKRKSREILRKFEPTAVQVHPRSLILVSMESACNFLLDINSNYGRISYSLQDIDAKPVGPQ